MFGLHAFDLSWQNAWWWMLLEYSGKKRSINSSERGDLDLLFHLKHQMVGYSGAVLLIPFFELLVKHVI